MPTEQRGHLFALRHLTDGGGQVAIGILFETEPTADERHEDAGVNAIQLLHGEATRGRQLHDAQSAAGAQHAMHLAKATLQVGIVANAEGYRYGVERGVGIGQRHAVLLLKGDAVRQSRLGGLTPTDGHHFFRQVGRYDADRRREAPTE